jgi:hypothetical protein
VQRLVPAEHQGECRGARFVEGIQDAEDAEFAIVATYARWKNVIQGKLDPIKGMMEGSSSWPAAICRRSFDLSSRRGSSS